MTSLYLSDVVTGLCATLPKYGGVYNRARFESALIKLAPIITQTAMEYSLVPNFIIRVDYGYSSSVRIELQKAVCRGIISTDTFGRLIQMLINFSESAEFLSRVPGKPEMYTKLASKFIKFYISGEEN